MWGWVVPLIKQIAQQKLSQSGKLGQLGSGLWQSMEDRQKQPGQYYEQYPEGGYLPQGQTPINNLAMGGYLPGQQSFLDAYWQQLLKQWRIR